MAHLSVLEQIKTALGGDVKDFDVEGIREDLRREHELADWECVDRVPEGEFWEIVQRHVVSGL